MNVEETVLAGKYAAAYLNIFIDSISLKEYNNIEQAAAFLHDNYEITTYFKLPRVHQEKKEIVDKIFNMFDVPESLKKLVDVLIQHKRLFLLKNVLNKLLELYKKRNNIAEFSIKTSHLLAQDQLNAISAFLSDISGKKVLAKSNVDKTLIAGIRAQSDEILWEYSVAGQLKVAKKLLQTL